MSLGQKKDKKDRVLSIRDLNISFTTNNGIVRAIRGIRFDLFKGETVAIVGESGSGKSVTMKTLMGILDTNGKIDSGTIEYTYIDSDGNHHDYDLVKMSPKEIRYQLSGQHIAMVFQDPMTSLNPLMPVGKQIMEGMIWHYHTPKEEAYEKALELMKLVGITDAEKRIKNYPHQLSGGMR